MRRLTLLVLASSVACGPRGAETAPAPRDPVNDLIGTEHPPRPASIVERSSFLVDQTARGRWVVAEIVMTTLGARAITLERVITPGTASTVRYRTVAVQRIAPADSLFPVHLGTCRANGRSDVSVVAVGSTAGSGGMRGAWRADTATGAFNAVDAATVRCEDVTDTR